MSSLVGKTLGSYQMVEPVGWGGAGIVYKAHQRPANRLFAIRVFRPLFAEVPEFMGVFVREAQKLAKLNHPHILPVYDFGVQDKTAYIVSEYVSSNILNSRLKPKQPLLLRDAITLILQACQALEYAHQQHVFHHDVKPNNMLLRREDFLLLSDFGIFQMVEDISPYLDDYEGPLIGTPQYMSPEQFAGLPNVGPRSDLYSLGIVLYQAVTGRVPFGSPGDAPLTIMLKHVSEPLPPPRQFVPDLPPPVEQVIIKALEKDPDRRYQSATEMIAALENIAGALGVPSRAAPTSQRAKPRVFVSHSHKNDDFTARFVADLRAAGVEVWVDMVNMQHGDFITRINQALDTSEWLVLVLTPEAIASEPVKTEVHAAISRVWRKRMKGFIPFMALPCDPETIPAMWDTFHRYDATKDYKRALAGLLRALGIE